MGHGIYTKARKDRSRDPLHPVRVIPISRGDGRPYLGWVADLDVVKMPLSVSADGDPAGHVRIVDANHMVVCRFARFSEALSMAEKLLRKLNDA